VVDTSSSKCRFGGRICSGSQGGKLAKYTSLWTEHIISNPSDPIIASACSLLDELERKISLISGDHRDSSHLFQRIFVLIQRYKAILLHDSSSDENRMDDWPLE